ncbi:thiamine pyrophosphate-dependent dehydrogenase E1 component subunit alpha [Georgenia yuyongxinii]|nr:thiamine pyrophosphate-dependent dehydrogenase E1 component subunit alpha [Georgenia yuyongxinii]
MTTHPDLRPGGAAVATATSAVLENTAPPSTLFDSLVVMWRIRFFEEEVMRLRAAGDVVGSVHLCNGQEAIYVGTCTALNLPDDLVFPTYRGHGWAIATGVPLDAMFGELLGREGGTNGGRGGSAYLSAPAYGMYGENSIVGAGAPIATGAALASTFDGSGRVTVAAFGEGAMNQGAVHEAMNFAASRKLPVLFVIENNHYSELTPSDSMVTSDRFYKRGSAYGIPGVRVDGNDVEAVRATVAYLVKKARDGGGPAIIEAMTERLVGHYIGDAQAYRPAGEVESASTREPIVRTENALVEAGMSRGELELAKERELDNVRQAGARALQMPKADPSTVRQHLYA